MNRKKMLSLLLAAVLLMGLSVLPVSADGEVNPLAGKTVTLTITPDKSVVCVGGQDVYVTFTVKLKSNDGTTSIPAFSFKLNPTAGMTLAESNHGTDPNFCYTVNSDLYRKSDAEGNKGTGSKYNVCEYYAPEKYFGAAGTKADEGITAETELMTIMAKFPKNTASGTYELTAEEFIAGNGEVHDAIADQFSTRTVVPGSVTVKAGVEISGTVTDEDGAAVNGAAMELYMDGKKVADGVTSNSSGQYTFSNVSTGSYTVKAKGSGVSGSANATVTTAAVTNANVIVKAGVTVSGTIAAWDNTNAPVVKLYASSVSDADIRTKMKAGAATDALSYTAQVGDQPTATTAVDGKNQYCQTFSLETIPEGTYKLAIYRPGKYVVKVVSVTVSGQNVALGNVKMWLYGDVNYDGKVNTTDGTAIYRKFAGKTSAFGNAPDPDSLIAADINNDSKVNTTDGTAIYRKFAGKTSAFDSIT